MTFLFPAKNQQGGSGTMEGGGRPSAPARVSMFRRLMMVRVTPAERVDGGGGGKEMTREKDERQPPAAPAAGAEAEVGSVGLDKMVISFMEESASSAAAAAVERPPRGRCAGNCFNGNTQDGSSSDDDDLDFFLPSASHPAASPPPAAAGDALELLKGLVQCASTAERNLLADAARVAERCRGGRKKAEVRRAVADGLRALGYDAVVCTSRWEKAAGHPAGEHEYIDAVVEEGVRLVVEVDFRSEFEVARPTKAYRAALQALPPLFVGTPERLGRVVAVVTDAARQSLRKRGLHFPPWRKHEYMRAKWLAPHARSGETPAPAPAAATPVSAANFSGEFELRFDEKPKAKAAAGAEDGDIPGGEDGDCDEGGDKKITVVVSPAPAPAPWRPVPAAASKLPPDQPPPPPQAKRKVVTGLASLLLLAT